MHRALLFATLLSFAGPAGAQTVVFTGTLSGSVGEVVAGQAPALDGTGVYAVRYRFDRPGGGVIIDYATEVETSYCYDIGLDTEFCGGDLGGSAAPGGFYFEAMSAPRQVSGIYKILRPIHLAGPGFLNNTDYSIDQTLFEYTFYEPGPVGYQVTVTRIADVPEPATWALMIAGFGLVGLAGRRSVSRAI